MILKVSLVVIQLIILSWRQFFGIHNLGWAGGERRGEWVVPSHTQTELSSAGKLSGKLPGRTRRNDQTERAVESFRFHQPSLA